MTKIVLVVFAFAQTVSRSPTSHTGVLSVAQVRLVAYDLHQNSTRRFYQSAGRDRERAFDLSTATTIVVFASELGAKGPILYMRV